MNLVEYCCFLSNLEDWFSVQLKIILYHFHYPFVCQKHCSLPYYLLSNHFSLKELKIKNSLNKEQQIFITQLLLEHSCLECCN